MLSLRKQLRDYCGKKQPNKSSAADRKAITESCKRSAAIAVARFKAEQNAAAATTTAVAAPVVPVAAPVVPVAAPVAAPVVPVAAPVAGAQDVDDEMPSRTRSCTKVERTPSDREVYITRGNCIATATNHICGGDREQVSHCLYCGHAMRDKT
jgi:hypothetical protein